MRAPDAVQFMVDVLAPILDTPVGNKASAGDSFVKVNRTGGPRPTPVSDQPQLTFEAYHRRPDRAWDLAEDTRQAVHALAGTVIEGVNVKNVSELAGPADLPDPLFPDHSRYTFTLAVHLRARNA